MQIGVAAHCEWCHNLKFTILTEEISHERIRVDVQIYLFIYLLSFI